MVAKKINTFRVTILGWDKHNANKKKGHQYFMVSSRFFDDHKIRALTSQERCAYLWLCSRCADETRATIVATAEQMRSAVGANTLRVESAIARLEENQLVKIEEITFLSNRIEKNRIEDKIKEDKFQVGRAGDVIPIKKDPPNSDLNRKIWEAYREEYFLKYGVDPVRNASVNGKISQFAKRLGAEAVDVVRFFVHHPKTFYVSKMHDIGLCLADAEALRTQWVNGKAITNSDLKNYEQNQERANLLKAIDEGRI